MKILNNSRGRIASAVLAIGMLSFAAIAQADPPIRAARLGYLDGPVSFATAGDNAWVEARLNRPITIGDSLWTDNNARTELQFGVATVRLDEYTSVQLLNLDDRTIQLQLTQGRVNVRARALRQGEVLEIATPNLAFTIRQAGDYRIDVDPRADATTVSVRTGAGEVYGEGAALTLRGKDAARFYGRDLRDREFYSLAPTDEFDRWSIERDRRAERALSARYVAPEVIGYADLDQYGSWRDAEGYGNVWFPRDVPREWAPYRYGHWSWIDPWGWTWVDDAPWGFAPFHYGRWATFGDRWGWVPGPINVRPVYAPALVVFVGGSNFRLSMSSGPASNGIGWFPLAPGEVYRPAYQASRDYVRNVNVSNTVVNTTVINNIYNNQTNVTQVNYRNAQVPNAVTAVSPTVFAQSQPVQRGMVSVTQDLMRRGQVTSVAAVAPTAMGMMGGAPSTNRRPSEEIVRREVVARAAPPAQVAPVAQRIDLLQRDPGRPLERSAMVTTSRSPTAPNVRVVGSEAPQAIPAQAQRGMGGPPVATQRSAGEFARPSSQSLGAGAPLPTPPGSSGSAGTMQRDRGGMGGFNAPSASPSAPTAIPSAPSPQAMQRGRGMGGADVPPAVQPSPAAPPTSVPQPTQRDRRDVAPAAQPAPAAPAAANAPQAMQRGRGMGGGEIPPAVQPSPAAPPTSVPQPTQRDRRDVAPAAQPAPAAPPANAPQAMQRGRGMGGADVAPAVQPSPAAPPASVPQPTQRDRRDVAPAAQSAPVAPPANAPQAMQRGRGMGGAEIPPAVQPSPAAPPTSLPQPTQRDRRDVAPAAQPAPAASPANAPQAMQRGRGGNDDDKKDRKDDKDNKDNKDNKDRR